MAGKSAEICRQVSGRSGSRMASGSLAKSQPARAEQPIGKEVARRLQSVGQRGVVRAPHAVDDDHQRFCVGMAPQEVADQRQLLARAGAEGGELDEMQAGRRRQSRRLEEEPVRIAEDAGVKARVATAPDVARYVVGIDHAGANQRREIAGVVGVDEDDRRQPDAEHDEKSPREARDETGPDAARHVRRSGLAYRQNSASRRKIRAGFRR
jgi:hypothetical protein